MNVILRAIALTIFLSSLSCAQAATDTFVLGFVRLAQAAISCRAGIACGAQVLAHMRTQNALMEPALRMLGRRQSIRANRTQAHCISVFAGCCACYATAVCTNILCQSLGLLAD